MQMRKGSHGRKIILVTLALASLGGLSACQQRFVIPDDRNVMASVYGNRSQSVIGDVYSRSSAVTDAPSFSGRW
ncbi:hypothetical protein [Cohnella thailandensis]|uniref:Uncharacterized protein n=1 Tax=Cohnella thailandensis TaxID=557557 RepID=A0A841T0K5_9BACL|nr:hypothetical protein [Cohnella thailandensis]MBB6636396.1 hypothetical protein [Cohnella thailandensis]MBP1973634.1 hypothetical protein [Cohnella thailandensis]